MGLLETLSFEQLEVLLQLTEVRVKIKETIRGLPEQFPWPLQKGLEIDVPLWLAEELIAMGVAEYSEPYGLKELESLLSKELVATRLVKVPPSLHAWILKAKEEVSAGGADPLAARRLFLTSRDLLKKRISKALRYVVLSTDSETVESRLLERLTPLERVVYAQIRLIIDRWLQLFIGEKGEDGGL
mgnify:CR=1 FL=1